MADLGAYLTAINKTKQNLMRENDLDDPQIVSAYPAFFIRRLLSYHEDAILSANIMNQLPGLDNQLQFEFFLHQLPAQKRYAPMYKSPESDNVELVKRYYNYSDEKAIAVLDFHTEQDFIEMRQHFSEGGVVKKPKKPVT